MNQRACLANLHRRGLVKFAVCEWGHKQTSHNTVDMCSLTQSPAEIQSFHDAEDDARKQSKTTAAAALIK